MAEGAALSVRAGPQAEGAKRDRQCCFSVRSRRHIGHSGWAPEQQELGLDSAPVFGCSGARLRSVRFWPNCAIARHSAAKTRHSRRSASEPIPQFETSSGIVGSPRPHAHRQDANPQTVINSGHPWRNGGAILLTKDEVVSDRMHHLPTHRPDAIARQTNRQRCLSLFSVETALTTRFPCFESVPDLELEDTIAEQVCSAALAVHFNHRKPALQGA